VAVASAGAGPYASLHLSPDNHTNIPPLFFTGQMPFLLPNQQRQSTEGNSGKYHGYNTTTPHGIKVKA